MASTAPVSDPTSARRAWVNLASVVGTITVNALANIIPFNGQNTGQVSDRFQVYFVPSGYVFAIWSVIYLAWLLFCAYQLLPANRGKPRFAALGYWFALSGVFNSLWLVCWHYNQFTLSLVVMLALLVTLIVSYRRLGVGRTPSGAVERWCVDAPFGLYLGWISVATIANVAIVLYALHWNGWGIAPSSWAMIMLVVGASIAVAVLVREHDVVFALVFVWALVGIGIQHPGASMLPLVAYGLAVGVTAAIVASLVADHGRYARGVGAT